MSKVVRILRRNASHEIVEASVRDIRTPVEVVARHLPSGEWEPLYGLHGTERKPLPHCFEFNGEALKALDDALAK